MKVNFIRKPTSEEMLPSDEFIIMKEIIVDEVSFSKFINNPLDDHDFIDKNSDLMYYDFKQNITKCILLKCTNKDYGFLINSEGSSYGRYVAYIPLALITKDLYFPNTEKYQKGELK